MKKALLKPYYNIFPQVNLEIYLHFRPKNGRGYSHSGSGQVCTSANEVTKRYGSIVKILKLEYSDKEFKDTYSHSFEVTGTLNGNKVNYKVTDLEELKQYLESNRLINKSQLTTFSQEEVAFSQACSFLTHRKK